MSNRNTASHPASATKDVYRRGVSSRNEDRGIMTAPPSANTMARRSVANAHTALRAIPSAPTARRQANLANSGKKSPISTP